MTRCRWLAAFPRCPDCMALCLYDLARNVWHCITHGDAWTSEALAKARGPTQTH
jgi:hypothetical protein